LLGRLDLEAEESLEHGGVAELLDPGLFQDARQRLGRGREAQGAEVTSQQLVSGVLVHDAASRA